MIVVLTRDSVRSEYVRREWQRALAQGDRIILARFRGGAAPSELSHAEVVDFRGAFQPALRLLLHSLGKTAAPSAKIGSLPRVPPWVALMTLLLAFVFLVPGTLFADWDYSSITKENLGLRIFLWVLLPFFFFFIIWHSCLAFLRRHMGMTRLALTLATFTGLFGFYLIGRTGLNQYATDVTRSTPLANAPIPILATIVSLGLIALGILILLRPEDLLRWCPTGKAWDVYRRGRVMKVPDIVTRFAQLKRFQLLHDLEDAPAAEQLRADLIHAGAVEANNDATATRVLLLTNRTTIAWLKQQSAALQKGITTVIGSAIGLPESLQWLWRRQWIDLRRWDAAQKRRDPVPAVPEGMTRLRIPVVVRATEHLLCATAGLLGVLANVVVPPNAPTSETVSPRELFQILIVVACCAWIACAWQLVHRTIIQKRFRRRLLVLVSANLILGGAAFSLFVSLGNNPLRVLLPAIFLLALPFLLRRQMSRLSFWFPAAHERGLKYVERLKPPRKWEPLVWTFIYMGVWMYLMGAQT